MLNRLMVLNLHNFDTVVNACNDIPILIELRPSLQSTSQAQLELFQIRRAQLVGILC